MSKSEGITPHYWNGWMGLKNSLDLFKDGLEHWDPGTGRARICWAVHIIARDDLRWVRGIGYYFKDLTLLSDADQVKATQLQELEKRAGIVREQLRVVADNLSISAAEIEHVQKTRIATNRLTELDILEDVMRPFEEITNILEEVRTVFCGDKRWGKFAT